MIGVVLVVSGVVSGVVLEVAVVGVVVVAGELTVVEIVVVGATYR